jgi:hypothetical protein
MKYAAMIALAVAVGLAGFGVIHSLSDTSKIDSLESQVTQQNGVVAGLREQLAQQGGGSDQSVANLSAQIQGLKVRLAKYDTCVPELMGQINSLNGTVNTTGTDDGTGNVTSTGNVYVYPSQQLSMYCQPLLTSPPNASANS